MNTNIETADKGARLANFFIDSILIVIVVSFSAGSLSLLFPSLLEEQAVIWNYWPLIVYFLYYFLFEYFLGQTPGKFLSRTWVVHVNGSKPGVRAVFIRTILRLIPFDIASYLLGLAGLHDLLSKTIVVKRKTALVKSEEASINLALA